MPDTDATRMVQLENSVSDDADEATALLILHPAWQPTLGPVKTKLLAARDILHDFNTSPAPT